MKIESIIVDMDGVLADFLGELYTRMKMKGYILTDKQERASWDLSKHFYGNDELILLDVEEIASQEEFWRNLPLMSEAIEEIFPKLCNKYDVSIATVPWKTAVKNCQQGKIQWIEDWLPDFDLNKLHFCINDDKFKMEADAMIEDSGKTLLKFNGVPIVYTAPHNEEFSGFIRVNSWYDIKSILL